MSEARPRARLVRHGETAWSKSGQHTSRTDLPLTPTGERQAKALGAVLGEEASPLVLTSPMQRATRTAELAGLLPYEISEDLCEWDYGDLEGRTTDDIRRDYPGWTIWTGPWPGGESPAAVGARADQVVSRLLQEPSGATVTVVAHGHILRVLAARWLGADVTAGRWLALDTATVSWLGWEREYRVIDAWNLQPPLDPPAPSR